MNFLKKYGDKVLKCGKKLLDKIKQEIGDLMIYTGLFLLPITTYQISPLAASYVFSGVLILVGTIIIRAKGGEK